MLAPFLLTCACLAQGPRTYDLSAATALLDSELPNLLGNVVVLVHQGPHEVFRYRAGTLTADTQVRLASLTKTVSAAVVLALQDEGRLQVGETLGATLGGLVPGFGTPGLGQPTLLDCFSMRSGIESPQPFEWLPLFDLAQSVRRVGATAALAFPPGAQLAYEGSGMQCTGYVCELRLGLPWGDLAESRIFAPTGMTRSDYLYFDPNPAVAGGMRGSADDLARFGRMVLAGGMSGATRVLSEGAVTQLFTNGTRGLPVFRTPFPATHPDYPHGVDPDYGFGGWVLAEHPQTQHVEEIVGAGAFGSFIWLDRRRGLSAVLVTDLPAAGGGQGSLDAALGLYRILRQATESEQVAALCAAHQGPTVRLTWRSPVRARFTQLYGSTQPIRDTADLRAATLLGRVRGESADVAPFAHYAALAELRPITNLALVPGANSL